LPLLERRTGSGARERPAWRRAAWRYPLPRRCRL